MGGVKGNFAGLKGISRKLAKLTGIDVATAQKVAGPLSSELARTFDAGQDPYGNTWPATKTQGPRVLNDTGALRASATSIKAQGKRLKGKLVSYGRYQKPQLLIPSAGNPPPTWEPIVHQAAEAAIAEVIGR